MSYPKQSIAQGNSTSKKTESTHQSVLQILQRRLGFSLGTSGRSRNVLGVGLRSLLFMSQIGTTSADGNSSSDAQNSSLTSQSTATSDEGGVNPLIAMVCAFGALWGMVFLSYYFEKCLVRIEKADEEKWQLQERKRRSSLKPEDRHLLDPDEDDEADKPESFCDIFKCF